MYEIKDKIHIPTGFLFTTECERGLLETLSIGDYGKAHNVKAHFLGFDADVEKVANMRPEPITEKWVVTLSTQYGCPMKCAFCDCPKVPFAGNASVADLKAQLYNALACFPDAHYAGRLNIHFARMGEPAFNAANVFKFTRWMHDHKLEIKHDTGVAVDVLHPVFTTSSPKALGVDAMRRILREWCAIKNDPHIYNGCAGLQLSINSTNEAQREEMFRGCALSLDQIADIAGGLDEPLGRKYCLNFALADTYEVDARKLAEMFDTDKFMVKITPIHNNDACREGGIETAHGYADSSWYRKAEADLIEAGFDTLIFVPSMDEEDGLVTCGNVALSGSVPRNAIMA